MHGTHQGVHAALAGPVIMINGVFAAVDTGDAMKHFDFAVASSALLCDLRCDDICITSAPSSYTATAQV